MIISASRRTDIPAFYSEWMISRLRAGEVLVRNPFNKTQVSRVPLTPAAVDCIVFWTKDAGPMLPFLDELDKLGYIYYFLYTLNPYGRGIECGFDNTECRLETFKELSSRLGAERVIWRYDPVLITGEYDKKFHLNAFGQLAAQLSGYTRKCVFSYLEEYRKIKCNMEGINLITPSDSLKREIAGGMSRLSNSNSIKLTSCAVDYNFSDLGIEENRCVDDDLIEELGGGNLKVKKDPAQRKSCGCVESKDIGTYNSCRGGCLYCYANINKEAARRKSEKYNPAAPMLCDELLGDEAVSLYKKNESPGVQNKQRELF
ncbi:MAG: DUF1848 domain-containing protein [Spirochaetales bacterium]|nr:DUF1848 domain-containing protein [Spirochaetales bacterium]